MAYVPTVWKNGDVITDVKMNKIEQGIANCYMPVLDLIDYFAVFQDGLAFKRSNDAGSGEIVTYFSKDYIGTEVPEYTTEKYLFYKAPSEIFNRIPLQTPILVLNSYQDTTSKYYGIGYATERTFYAASELEDDNESGFVTFDDTYNCVIIDTVPAVIASSDIPITRIIIMPQTAGEHLRLVDPFGSSTPAPIG